MQRRQFLKSLTGASASAFVPGVAESRQALRYLRPPGALAEAEFTSRCIRCGQCGEACPNRCINYFGLENGLKSTDTPPTLSPGKRPVFYV